MKPFQIYVGTYTKPNKSLGIYSLRMDAASGKLTPPELAAEIANPTFLTLDPTGRRLYAVSELGSAQGRPGGLVWALAIDPDSGELEPLNQRPSGGTSPCHVTVAPDDRHLLVANYGSGSVAVLPIGPGGLLGEATEIVQHAGTGPNAKRQEGPHAHSVNLDPAGRLALVADLGIDKMMVYRFDSAAGKLAPNDPPSATLAPGAGPRHLAFDPAGRFAYVINELNSTVTAFAYDAPRGELREVQTLSTLPGDFHYTSWASEVRVHPSGKWLYASNRGHDSIAVFEIESGSGRLTPVAYEPTLGKWPRHFAIDATGKLLLAANQNSDSMVCFRIDPGTGRLAQAAAPIEVPCPVCVCLAGEAE
jgi:6-phosphogluconolactonase